MKKKLIFGSAFVLSTFLMLCVSCNAQDNTSKGASNERSQDKMKIDETKKDVKEKIDQAKKDVHKKVEDTKKSLQDSSDKAKEGVKNTYGAVQSLAEKEIVIGEIVGVTNPSKQALEQKEDTIKKALKEKEDAIKKSLQQPSEGGVSQQVNPETDVNTPAQPNGKVDGKKGDDGFDDEDSIFDDKESDDYLKDGGSKNSSEQDNY
jgi:hypothetical protein